MTGSSAFELSGKVVIIISPEDWGENLLSKHHIAIALARRNNTVWFVCPSMANFETKVQSIIPGLSIIRHKPLRGINKLPGPIARLMARFEVRRILGIIRCKVDIVWSFDPYQLQFLRLFNAGLTIYHPVDNHYTDLEKRITREADVVLSNSEATLLRLVHQRKHKVGHGVAAHFFDEPDPVTVPGGHNVKVGYAGNLNNRLFDVDTFCQLAKSYPDIGFYLAGPRASSNLSSVRSHFLDWSVADKLNNVYWLGQLPSSRIPSFLKQMDILLVLYKPDESGFTVNAHKILEYLSSGKLVICPFHEENKTIEGLLLQARTLSDLPEIFEKAVHNLAEYLTPGLCNTRISQAAKMTYEIRLQEIENILNRRGDND